MVIVAFKCSFCGNRYSEDETEILINSNLYPQCKCEYVMSRKDLSENMKECLEYRLNTTKEYLLKINKAIDIGTGGIGKKKDKNMIIRVMYILQSESYHYNFEAKKSELRNIFIEYLTKYRYRSNQAYYRDCIVDFIYDQHFLQEIKMSLKDFSKTSNKLFS